MTTKRTAKRLAGEGAELTELLVEENGCPPSAGDLAIVGATEEAYRLVSVDGIVGDCAAVTRPGRGHRMIWRARGELVGDACDLGDEEYDCALLAELDD